MISELKREWPWHVLFWAGYMIIKIGIVEYFRQDLLLVIYAELVSLPLKMAALYLLIYFLIPQFLLRKKYIQFVLLLVVSVFLLAFARRATDVFIIYPVIVLYGDEAEFLSLSRALRNLIYIYPVVGLGTAIHLMTHWIRDYHKALTLSKEKLAAELKFLKAQIHPHFLFNTINNIYSLALDKSSEVPNALVKLSDLLSYMIYECNVDRISLLKELEMLESYIELEKLRYGNRLNLTFEKTGNFSDVQIAPLILLPFVDNSFKHGPGEMISRGSIEISLAVSISDIHFKVRNTKPISQKDNKTNSGIGLNNIRKRLNAEYPDLYTLNIEEGNEFYNVDLVIKML